MKNSISFAAANKKQLIQIQARTRRLCRMLGMAPLEQAKVVSVLFELTFKQLGQFGQVLVDVEITDEDLKVRCRPPEWFESPKENSNSLSQFAMSLPPDPERLASEDIVWTLHQLQSMDKVSVFEEIRQQNNDLMRAILEVEKLSPEILRVSIDPFAA